MEVCNDHYGRPGICTGRPLLPRNLIYGEIPAYTAIRLWVIPNSVARKYWSVSQFPAAHSKMETNLASSRKPIARYSRFKRLLAARAIWWARALRNATWYNRRRYLYRYDLQCGIWDPYSVNFGISNVVSFYSGFPLVNESYRHDGSLICILARFPDRAHPRCNAFPYFDDPRRKMIRSGVALESPIEEGGTMATSSRGGL